MDHDAVVSTDGSCLDNPGGPGAWAFVYRTDDGRVECSDARDSTTNNRAELIAILAALRFSDEGDSLLIRSDSKYAINVCTGKWSAKANRDILRHIWKEMESRDVTFTWVKAHTGDRDNERADTLALETAIDGANE
jgi:ribonuclease HI